ncbi:hypothetical protein LOAG_03002 [Loa loa]|uniref:Uncharacterized protein n=1 Tax=Loa loa TaxID=7209 RepID=A0A1S0U5E1_LOALO|nr:hypothetical protein LOAG_03002 [Loa loa]EFO25489.1 hypothetical protein LOAG_03002 [Loa loa]
MTKFLKVARGLSEQVLSKGDAEEVAMSKHHGSVEGDTRKETLTPILSSFLLRVRTDQLSMIGVSGFKRLLPAINMCVIHTKSMNHPCAIFSPDASIYENSDEKLPSL